MDAYLVAPIRHSLRDTGRWEAEGVVESLYMTSWDSGGPLPVYDSLRIEITAYKNDEGTFNAYVRTRLHDDDRDKIKNASLVDLIRFIEDSGYTGEF